jgi:hypothetical protein
MDPVDSASRWHGWSVKGDGGVLSRVIEGLDARRLPGWQRLRGEALKPFQSLVRPGSAWYSLGPAAAHAGVTLSVERVLDAELRGGRVWFGAGPSDPLTAATAPPGSIAGAWDQVMRFLDEGIVPAARAVPGASVQVPSTEDLFLGHLPIDVAERLRTFSRAARKVLPLDQAETGLWHGFVISASRDKAVIDPRRFVDWLTGEAWRREDALELSLRFFDQCLLLSRYADEVSAA